jgi:hypothetical protein
MMSNEVFNRHGCFYGLFDGNGYDYLLIDLGVSDEILIDDLLLVIYLYFGWMRGRW